MSRRILFMLAVAIGLSLLWATGVVADMNMHEGMWEMTMKMEMPGMPFEVPPTKFSQCMTKKDAVPHKKDKDEDCKTISTKIEGNTVYWKAQCRTKEGTFDSEGKITYAGSSFNGVMKMIMNDASSGKMEVTNHMSGRRTGDCK
ncbi:MAG TPA: DUF3617 family protein, partial [Thermodesulfovibrionales bacterium]|nr:DUF3617 family protein [Thermodesulfovibrionales bacterium]